MNKTYILQQTYIHPAGSIFKGVIKSAGEWLSIFPNLSLEDLDNKKDWFKQNAPTRPPLGLKPLFIHNEQRLTEIMGAIFRFQNDNACRHKKVPQEWLDEMNDLEKWLYDFNKRNNVVVNYEDSSYDKETFEGIAQMFKTWIQGSMPIKDFAAEIFVQFRILQSHGFGKSKNCRF